MLQDSKHSDKHEGRGCTAAQHHTVTRWIKWNILKSHQDRAGASDWTPQKKTKQLQLIQSSPAGVWTRTQSSEHISPDLYTGSQSAAQWPRVQTKDGKQHLDAKYFSWACCWSRWNELCYKHKTASYLSCKCYPFQLLIVCFLNETLSLCKNMDGWWYLFYLS